MDLEEKLRRIRERVAGADERLYEALEARAGAVRELVQLQQAYPDAYLGLQGDAELLRHAKESLSLFPAEWVEPLMRELLGACASLRGPTLVAFAGSDGGFAHQAARRHFGAGATLGAFETAREVFEEVERGRVSFGILPLESSSDGAVSATLLGLVESEAKICGEITLSATYDLFSRSGKAREVEKIYGVGMALGACERHLRAHFPRATLVDVPSGRIAAQLAVAESSAAALGPPFLSELDEVLRVEEHLEDSPDVRTRYAIVGGELASRTGLDRTILALSVQDEPGALYRALAPLAERRIDLTRVESRPAPGGNGHLFFVELTGHITDRQILTAVDELRSLTRELKVLGSYPQP